jgi:hypothetical protein
LASKSGETGSQYSDSEREFENNHREEDDNNEEKKEKDNHSNVLILESSQIEIFALMGSP